MHARTHPGEVGSSFVAEGLLNFLASDADEARSARRHFVFHVLPMLNPDGVAAANYRSTPRSENLEVMWSRAGDFEAPAAPSEVRVAQELIFQLDAEVPFCAALNLHASHEELDTLPHLVRHFGPTTAGYAGDEADLWGQQVALAEAANGSGLLRVNAEHKEGGRRFLELAFPETFWWHHAGARVLASTFETVYGQVGVDGAWISPDEQRSLGESLGRGIAKQQLARASGN